MTLRQGAAGSRAGCRPSELSRVRYKGRVELLTAEISEGVGLGTWRHADLDPRGELSVLRKNPYLLAAGGFLIIVSNLLDRCPDRLGNRIEVIR
jgi:hypothetical protein